MTESLPYRQAIRGGQLSVLHKAMTGSPREMQLAMIAMELTGLSPKRLSSPKRMAEWKQVKNRSIF